MYLSHTHSWLGLAVPLSLDFGSTLVCICFSPSRGQPRRRPRHRIRARIDVIILASGPLLLLPPLLRHPSREKRATFKMVSPSQVIYGRAVRGGECRTRDENVMRDRLGDASGWIRMADDGRRSLWTGIQRTANEEDIEDIEIDLWDNLI